MKKVQIFGLLLAALLFGGCRENEKLPADTFATFSGVNVASDLLPKLREQPDVKIKLVSSPPSPFWKAGNFELRNGAVTLVYDDGEGLLVGWIYLFSTEAGGSPRHYFGRPGQGGAILQGDSVIVAFSDDDRVFAGNPLQLPCPTEDEAELLGQLSYTSLRPEESALITKTPPAEGRLAFPHNNTVDTFTVRGDRLLSARSEWTYRFSLSLILWENGYTRHFYDGGRNKGWVLLEEDGESSSMPLLVYYASDGSRRLTE